MTRLAAQRRSRPGHRQRGFQRALFAVIVTSIFLTANIRADQTGLLLVELTGMNSDDGSLVYAIWSDPQHWLEADPLREGSVPVESGSSVISVRGLPYGEYALSAYHDLNGNMKLDTGLFGIPKEPIGTSNNAKVRFGPPKFEDAVFQLDEPQLTITINVRKVL